MSSDHSLVNEQVAAGIISEDEARQHQLRNVITRSVGYQEEELVDTFAFPLQADDLLLLCSDGLSGKLLDQEISGLASKTKRKQAQKNSDENIAKELDDAISEMIALANERGGEDNITVLMIRVLHA